MNIDKSKRRPIAVKVLLWLNPDRDAWGAGILTQEWQGATRLDRRWSGSHAMPPVGSIPHGVDQDLYLAWLALNDFIASQVKAAEEGAR